jgi:hypothetical protein
VAQLTRAPTRHAPAKKKKKKARKGSIAGGVAQVVECLSNNIFASIPQNIPFSSF